MAYDVDDIIELIHYHLVLGQDDDTARLDSLRRIVIAIDEMATTGDWLGWQACERCGAWVDSDLIGPHGAGVAADGGFYCSSCRWDGED